MAQEVGVRQRIGFQTGFAKTTPRHSDCWTGTDASQAHSKTCVREVCESVLWI